MSYRPQNHPCFGRERNRFTFNLPRFLHGVWAKVIISDPNLKESDLFMAWGMAWQEIGEKRNSVHIPRPESYPALRTRLIGFPSQSWFSRACSEVPVQAGFKWLGTRGKRSLYLAPLGRPQAPVLRSSGSSKQLDSVFEARFQPTSKDAGDSRAAVSVVTLGRSLLGGVTLGGGDP